MRQKLAVYFDGGFGPNGGGTATYGYVVKNDSGETIHSSNGRVGQGPEMSSNVGEYEGIYQAMLYIKEHYPEAEVDFYGDSFMVIAQLKGEYRVKKGKYVPYYHKTAAVAKPFIEAKLWTFRWVSRAFNSEADNLTQINQA